MKRLILLLAVCLAVASCKTEPISRQATNNPNLPISLLFEVDGCKVYRFVDGSQSVYFTTCKGKVSYDYTTRSGKSSTTHHVESLTEELP